jgi:hypothetical protein
MQVPRERVISFREQVFWPSEQWFAFLNLIENKDRKITLFSKKKVKEDKIILLSPCRCQERESSYIAPTHS